MVKIPEGGGVKPIERIEEPHNNPNKPKRPEEAVEEAKDTVELSEVAKLTLELKSAEEELERLPNSQFWIKRVLEIKMRLDELKKKQK